MKPEASTQSGFPTCMTGTHVTEPPFVFFQNAHGQEAKSNTEVGVKPNTEMRHS